MAINRWWRYLDEQLREREWTPADLARKSGVSQSRIGHWRDTGAAPTIKNARAIAAALEVPLLVVLVEAGVLTSNEAMLRVARTPSLDEFSTRQLLREIERRYAELEARREMDAEELAEHYRQIAEENVEIAQRYDAIAGNDIVKYTFTNEELDNLARLIAVKQERERQQKEQLTSGE